jgi:hypothetical protein
MKNNSLVLVILAVIITMSISLGLAQEKKGKILY